MNPLDLRNGEQLSSTFREINPDCTVPVLELDDGATLSEVFAICQYLEETHPEPNILGQDARERALVTMWNSKIEQQGLTMLPLEYWIIVAVTIVAVVACVSLHYEGLRLVARIPIGGIINRHRIIIMILCADRPDPFRNRYTIHCGPYTDYLVRVFHVHRNDANRERT